MADLASLDTPFGMEKGMNRPGHWTKQVTNVVTSPVRALLRIAQITEEGPRVAEFARSRGLNPGQMVRQDLSGRAGERAQFSRRASEQGAFAGRNITVDFARRGMVAQQVNALIPFMTPGLGGTLRIAETIKNHPVKMTVKGFAAITVPSVALEILNQGQEGYNELPDYVRNHFWVFPTQAKDPLTGELMWTNDGRAINNWHKIPKPFQYGMFFGTLPQLMARRILADDPRAFDGFMKSLGDVALPGIFPTFAQPAVEAWADRQFFTGSPSLGPTLSGVAPELQIRPWTTELSKKTGAILAHIPFFREEEFLHGATSPILIENWVRAWTGTNGTTLMNLTSDALSAAGILPPHHRPADTLADVPLARAFQVRRPSGSAQSIVRFWERHGQMQTRIKSVAHAAETDPMKAFELQQRWFGKMQDMSDTASALSQAAKYVRAVTLEEPPEGARPEDELALAIDKRMRVDAAMRGREATARFANEMMDNWMDAFGEEVEELEEATQ